jgi:hypothetical protein
MKKILLILLMVIWAQSAGAVITYVSPTAGGSQGGSSSSSVATSALNDITGNLIVVTINGAGGTTTSVTDTALNTYVAGSGCTTNPEIWYAKNITGNAANVVTANFGSSPAFASVSQAQYAGASTTAPFQVCTTSSGTQFGSASSGSFTPTTAGSVAIGTAISSGDNVTSITSYATAASSNTFIGHLLNPALSSQTATVNFSNSGNSYSTTFAVFLPPAAATTHTNIIRGNSIIN